MAFQPGQSGNPSGRPKEDPLLKEMARAKTSEAFEVVLACLADSDKKIALKAAEIVLDRGFGKAPQGLHVMGEEGGPVKHVFEWAK